MTTRLSVVRIKINLPRVVVGRKRKLEPVGVIDLIGGERHGEARQIYCLFWFLGLLIESETSKKAINEKAAALLFLNVRQKKA